MDIYFIIIIIIAIIAIIYLISINNIKENFETYSYGPYNYMDSGASPLTFYKYPIYRKPYMFPYKFHKSYPYPHMSYYETNI